MVLQFDFGRTNGHTLGVVKSLQRLKIYISFSYFWGKKKIKDLVFDNGDVYILHDIFERILERENSV